MKSKILSFLFLAFSLILNSQNVWSLQQCILKSWENNLNLKTSELGLQQADVAIKQAKNNQYPNLSFSKSIYWNFGRTIDPTSNAFTTNTFFRNGMQFNSGVMLYNGGVLHNTVKQSKINKNATEEDILQAKNDIALEVASYYLNALFAKENITIAQSNLDLTNTSLGRVKSLVQSGTRPVNDILDVESQLATDEQNLIIAENNYTVTLMQLKQAINTDEDFSIIAPANLEIENKDLLTLDEVYGSALKTQHSIAAQELKVKSADMGVKIANGQKYPTLTFGGNIGSNYSNQGYKILGKEKAYFDQEIIFQGISQNIQIAQEYPITEKAGYFYQLTNYLSYGVGFNINVPIFNNYQTKAGIERAKINSETTHLKLANDKLALRLTVQRALTDAKAAKAKYDALNKTLQATQAVYDNATKKFDIGAINTFDLNTAKTRLDNAKNNLLIAKYDLVFRNKIIDFYLGKKIDF